MTVYPIAVAGESFSNADGTSRQAEIARCRVGEYVRLIREPANPYDPAAVLVVSRRGRGIGYIARDYSWIAELIDDGCADFAFIYRINGGQKPEKLGVVIGYDPGADTPDDAAFEPEPRMPPIYSQRLRQDDADRTKPRPKRAKSAPPILVPDAPILAATKAPTPEQPPEKTHFVLYIVIVLLIAVVAYITWSAPPSAP